MTVPPHAGQTPTAPGSSVVARTALFDLLSASGTAGVILISAPAGSGKTVLLRSWLEMSALADRVAWVSVERRERDAQRFWISVVEKLGPAVEGRAALDKLTPAPDFDGEALVERLVSQLGSLEQPVALVIDDLHELGSPDALAQLELLIARRPPLLRLVLATRRDPQLGLHHLRLWGQLTEVRASDLRFTLEETRELLSKTGIALSDESIALLQARTEGWAAGLRLAALSLAGHPDPDGFLTEFSGSERTVAEYLLAEVLERQPGEVRTLLLRTSILEHVNGALADVLAESSGSEAILQALEQGNAFVVSVDASRSWFRYHQLFADLLQLQLRRTEPEMVVDLHRTAAGWYAEHGYVVDAVRHAQAAGEWSYAAHLLIDHEFSLLLNGEGGTLAALIGAFPREESSDPELALLFATAELEAGSLEEVATYISLAERNASGVPPERGHRFEVALAVARASLARRRGDFGSVAGEVQLLLGRSDAETLGELALSNDARAIALLSLGIVELYAARFDEAEHHLQQGLELARRIARPYVAIGCLGHLALLLGRKSFALERKLCEEAIGIAEANGWTSEPITCAALLAMALAEVTHGRFDDAEKWLDRAERASRPHLEPATELLLQLARGRLYVGRGRLEEALAAFAAAEQLQTMLVGNHVMVVQIREFLVYTQLRLGDLAGAGSTLERLSDEQREWGETRAAFAALHLEQGDADSAIKLLAPILADTAPVLRVFSKVQALILDAIAHDRIGDRQSAEADIERALSVAEPERLIFPFVMTPALDLLERHPRHRTAHAALLTDILDVLSGSSLPPKQGEPVELSEDMSPSELRVLGYLPSNLSAPEIASELFLSTSTVKTHMRHIYAKLGVHSRTEAVERARRLGLLASSR